MSTTNPIQPAAATSAQSAGLPLVLVRSDIPPLLLTIAGFLGSPANNMAGLAVLAEAIRASLGEPLEPPLYCGEFRKGCVLVACGPFPPGRVIEACLGVLRRIRQEDYFTILVWDPRENFYRPQHQGAYSGDTQPLTAQQVADEAAAFLAEWMARQALFKKALGE